VAAVKFDDPLGDGQAQAGPLFATDARRVVRPEPSEHLLVVPRIDPGTVVRHGQPSPRYAEPPRGVRTGDLLQRARDLE